MTYETVASHRRMVTDKRRQDAYRRALAQVVTTESVVLDLGAGLGILGVMAAQMGAAHVYCVEPADISGLIPELASRNGVADRVTVLQARGSEVDLPDVDVLVSVMTGNLLVTEDLLGALFDSRDRFLGPGGQLIPSKGVLSVAPVDAPRAFARAAGWAANPIGGVDLTAASSFIANTVTYDREMFFGARPLADPLTATQVDFATARPQDLDIHASVGFDVTETATLHGLAGWMSIRLADEWFSTSPFGEPTHWRPALFPLDRPHPVTVGDRIECELRRPSGGEWTWTVAIGDHKEFHSTRASIPVGPATLDRLSDR